MSVMAMVLSDFQNLNTTKILKMSLLHDLSESIIGDHILGDITNKKKLENITMKKIIKKLPGNTKNEYLSLWLEYQTNKTNEAILLHEIDKFEMAFQAKIYSTNIKNVKQFYNTSKSIIKNKQLKMLFTKLISEQKL